MWVGAACASGPPSRAPSSSTIPAIAARSGGVARARARVGNQCKWGKPSSIMLRKAAIGLMGEDVGKLMVPVQIGGELSGGLRAGPGEGMAGWARAHGLE
ncbi:hypothetical protein NUTIK01_24680 [Novosphingobium sp. IK01]|uniref:Uncharacterized protein n=1 Tax=Novosphingobium pituita TaxID=3056842 RepID=A0ABQ6PC89_9SPHN|nr:hypothetical protein NUTIK01_24680 [Novosphingobium sp. IK01]